MHFRHMKRLWMTAGVVSCLLALDASRGPAFSAQPEPVLLENGLVRAEFGARGLLRLTDPTLDRSLAFAEDMTGLSIDGEMLTALEGDPSSRTSAPRAVTYTWELSGGRSLRVVYEVQPGWRFLSKQLFLDLEADAVIHVDRVVMQRARLATPPLRVDPIRGGKYGAFLRFGAADAPDWGALFTLQNPFVEWHLEEGVVVSLAYDPDMEWRAGYGPFASDRCLIAPYALSGIEFPKDPVPEWHYIADPSALDGKETRDINETLAFATCVQAFIPYRVTESTKVHVGWCENDYQIDVSTPAGREQYRRIFNQAAAVGCKQVLYSPSNSHVSSPKDSVDAWGWENILWLGLGQKIRKDEWMPGRDPVPPSVQDAIDYARGRGIGLIAYVFPSMRFLQDPEWTAWTGGDLGGGYAGADTGLLGFQDWFIRKLVDFQEATGVEGFSFDHWWLGYGGKATSKYAQWFGCRRILESLRREIPELVIDGRQSYHWMGPWTWLGGSYPHPMMSDEQPGSYENFPDLHFDRVSANRQRYAAWHFRMVHFCPIELLPGFMTHQTVRWDDWGTLRRDDYRLRDWDYLGWRYSVISSIGTAPLNHVVNYLPARDRQEFENFAAEDQKWLRDWMSWTDDHVELLKRLRPIIGQPMIGHIDGTAAFLQGEGFIFLFNPNYREMPAEFALDESIGLDAGGPFVIEQLYPHKGLLHEGPHGGLWRHGDAVSLPIAGPAARVLAVRPAGEIGEPLLMNVTGKVQLARDGALALSEVEGQAGVETGIAVRLPEGAQVRELSVNGIDRPFLQEGDVVRAAVRFAGSRVDQCPQIGQYDPAFEGGTWRGQLEIPVEMAEQLDQRRYTWPIVYTEDDLRATWVAPWRLLLFVHIADPKVDMEVAVRIANRDMEVRKAFGGVNPSGDRTFLGFYVNVSTLSAGRKVPIEVDLPELAPGQFQGVFLDNVETIWTDRILSE